MHYEVKKRALIIRSLFIFPWSYCYLQVRHDLQSACFVKLSFKLLHLQICCFHSF